MAIILTPTGMGSPGGTGGGDFSNPFTSGYASKDHQSFGEENGLNRYFGDVFDQYMDPYTTGVGYVIWEKIPTQVIPNADRARLFLANIAQSFTLPSITLNAIEYNGLNNLKWGVPGTAELDSQTFTVRMIEWKDAPVIQLIGRWVTMIRDINYGVANMSDYTQSAYKGRVLYASTDVTGKNVQFAALFTGVFPTRVPLDALSLDTATQDKVEPDFEFHFDMMFIGDETVALAQSRVDSVFSSSIGKLQQVYAPSI